MADPFEKELEDMVSRVSHELAREITALILRRLGISGTTKAEPEGRRRAGRPRGLGKLEASHAAPSRAKIERSAPPKAKGKRTRASAEDRASAIALVGRIVEQSGGVSVGEIERKSKLSRAIAQGALKALKEEGRAFMGGTKRFARYASTQDEADRASQKARGA